MTCTYKLERRLGSVVDVNDVRDGEVFFLQIDGSEYRSIYCRRGSSICCWSNRRIGDKWSMMVSDWFDTPQKLESKVVICGASTTWTGSTPW